MIKSVKVVNYLGEDLTMYLKRPGDTGLSIINIDGLMPSDANINTTELAPTVKLSGGDLFNSSKVRKRNIVIDMKFYDLYEDVELLRHKTYKYFPVGRMLTLYILTDTRHVKITGWVESNNGPVFSKECGTRISIICPDPYFYSADINSLVNTNFSGIENALVFPLVNSSLTEKQIVFGIIHAQTENLIEYLGDVETGLFIYIHAIGSIENIRIVNTITRELMGIDHDLMIETIGTGILAGDDIIINTNIGAKSIILIREGIGYNVLNAKIGTDWLTLVKGDNLFAFTADFGIANLQLRMENLIVYEGI